MPDNLTPPNAYVSYQLGANGQTGYPTWGRSRVQLDECAILLWEKGVVDEHKLTPKPSENFVDFEHVMKATNVKQADRESLTQYRNNVMHGKIGDNPLSEVPQDLKPYWEDLLKADELKTKRPKLRERNRPQKRSTESNKRGKNL